MKRTIAMALAIITALSLCACGEGKAAQDTSPVTMLVTYGNGEAYFSFLKEKVRDSLGIDIEFLYETSSDPTDQLKLDFANGSLPADIVFTSAKVPDEYLKDSCVDLITNTHLTSYFTYGKVKECTADDGGVYQLPVCSKLIGIAYNATLMEEMGWEIPQNFEDMLELKARCEKEGIPFAVSDFRETGHGFNYLFHIMGAQWLSKMDGTEWIEGFIGGDQPVDEFRKQSGYFDRWVENGLFGSINLEPGWGATSQFSRTRALFCFAILNNSSGYDGPMYDENGNETGKELHDMHRTMPWISENGENNCFTYYDNSWISISRDLLEESESEKLAKALQIVEYMTSDEFAEYTSSLAKDIYLPFNGYTMSEDRLYSGYEDEIASGFIQPWYYSYFDSNTIVRTGAEIGSYVLNMTMDARSAKEKSKDFNYAYYPDADFGSVFEVLHNNNNNKGVAANAVGTIEEKLEYGDTARLCAICGAYALQSALDEDGNNALVRVSLLPYADDIRDMQPWRDIAVENAVVYPGTLDVADQYIIVPKQCGDVCGIWMTGAQIKGIVDRKYDPSSRTPNFDSESYGPYSYACVTRDGTELNDETEYLVAVPAAALEEETYNFFADAGKVVTMRDGSGILYANTASGIGKYFAEHPSVNRSSIEW